MKLWSGTLSPFSAKVRVVIAEKGIDVEIADLPWTRATLWEPKPKEFLTATHKGEVPVLVVEGQSIIDSTVINEYLEDAYPEPALMPNDPLERAACRMWEDMADAFIAVHVTTLIREVFQKADGVGRDNAAVAQSHEAFGGYLAALDRRLGSHDYLSTAYSVADIATWICFVFAQTLGITLDGHAGVKQWFERIQARPVVAEEAQRVMAAAVKA